MWLVERTERLLAPWEALLVCFFSKNKKEIKTNMLDEILRDAKKMFKTESARTSSSYWTKLCTKIIYTLLQAFVLLLQISYQKKSFLTTPNIENRFRSSAEFH